MAYRKRRFFNDKQKAEIWDRWQRGESMSSIGRHFDRASSSIYPLLERTGGGLLVQPDSPAALAQALAGLRKDPERRRKLGAHGKEIVHGQFGDGPMAEKTLALYQSLLAD